MDFEMTTNRKVILISNNPGYAKFGYWDCRGSPTNTKIPHLRVHKPQIAVVGRAVVKTA